MKKTLLIATLVVLALGALGAGVAFAQGAQPTQPYNPGMMMGGRGGYGAMHDYVEQALADKLGLTETQVEEQLAAGVPMYQIALDNGVAEADLPAFFTEVHTIAFEKAVADGVLTQTQADAMLARMQERGWGADCPNEGIRPMDGSGFQRGHGFQGAGRRNQPSEQTNP